MDGSTTDLPNSRENAGHFGWPSNATRAGAFPQARWSTSASHGHLVRVTVGWAHMLWRAPPGEWLLLQTLDLVIGQLRLEQQLIELINRRCIARILGHDRILGSDLGYSMR